MVSGSRAVLAVAVSLAACIATYGVGRALSPAGATGDRPRPLEAPARVPSIQLPQLGAHALPPLAIPKPDPSPEPPEPPEQDGGGPAPPVLPPDNSDGDASPELPVPHDPVVRPDHNGGEGGQGDDDWSSGN